MCRGRSTINLRILALTGFLYLQNVAYKFKNLLKISKSILKILRNSFVYIIHITITCIHPNFSQINIRYFLSENSYRENVDPVT